MPRPWENFEESYPGHKEEVFGPETAADGTKREEFYDKMVAKGWNKQGDDDIIMAMYLKTALHFNRHDKTKPTDNAAFSDILNSDGNDPRSRKKAIDRCKALFTDSKNPNLTNKAESVLDDESRRIGRDEEKKRTAFAAQMRAKGWTHEGDDKIINMLFDLPNNRLSPNDPKTFRGTTCLSANGNGVESRRDLFKKAVDYIKYDINDSDMQENAQTLAALEKELEKHNKLILLDDDNYENAVNRMPEAEIAYEKSKVLQKLSGFMYENDVMGAVNYMLDAKKRQTQNYNQNIDDPHTDRVCEVIDEWLADCSLAVSEERMYQEGQLFLFDLYAEVQARVCETQLKVGQLIEEQEEKIRKNPPKGSDLLIDNPKIVTAMAKEYFLCHSKHDVSVDFDTQSTLLSQLTICATNNRNFDRSKRPLDLKGVEFNAGVNLGSEQAEYVSKYGAMIVQKVANRHKELSQKKKNKYLTDEVNPRHYSGERYEVKIRKGENGELEIAELPDKTKEILNMSKEELLNLREKEKKMLAANEKIKLTVEWFAKDFVDLFEEFKGFMNKNHPAWSKCKPIYNLLEELKETSSSSSSYSTVDKLNSLLEAVDTYKENYGGDILNEGGRRNDFISKAGHTAERFRANLRGLIPQAHSQSFIDRDISDHKETIRRIDKQLELRYAEPAPTKEVGYVPNPSAQVADILEAVNNAEAAVWKSSSEYKRANRSLIELDRAFKAYNDVPVGLVNLRKDRLDRIKTLIGQTRTDIKGYFDRKRRQGLYYGGADVKTQRRINIMISANLILSECDRFVDDVKADIDYVPPAYVNDEAFKAIYGDDAEQEIENNAEQGLANVSQNKPENAEQEIINDNAAQEIFEKIDIAPERRNTFSQKENEKRVDSFVEKKEQALKEAKERAERELKEKQERELKEQQEREQRAREERAKNPVDIDAELKNAQTAISKMKKDGKDINSPEYDKHLATIITCMKVNHLRRNAGAFEEITGEYFDNLNQGSTLSNPVFEKMLKQTKREDLIEQATHEKGQNLFTNYRHTSDQLKAEKNKIKEEQDKLNEEAEKLKNKAEALENAIEPQSFFRPGRIKK